MGCPGSSRWDARGHTFGQLSAPRGGPILARKIADSSERLGISLRRAPAHKRATSRKCPPDFRHLLEETIMQRRAFLAGAAAAATLAAVKPTVADELSLGNLPNWRYPDDRVEVLDKRFKYKVGNAAIERVATGFRWAEGPAYNRAG